MSPNLPPDAGDVYLHDEPSPLSLPASIQPAASITAQLASRFHSSLPATRISSNGLVVFNTYQAIIKGSAARKGDATPAEVVDVVDGALARLSRLSENQTFLFLGESGSGKSTVRSQVLAEILKRSQNQLSTMAAFANSVFDSLTTTKTSRALASSKSNFLYQLRFDTSQTEPVLTSGTIVNHFLQRSRITHTPTNEGSYRILHYLVAGASDVETAHYGFKNHQGSMNRWKILGPSAHLRKNPRDMEGLHLFKRALWELKFHQVDVEQICELFAVVLHLGQLEFQQSEIFEREDPNGDRYLEDCANLVAVHNPETLDLVSAFLGVEASYLEALIVTQTRTVGAETITVALSPLEAQENAAGLASMLYSLITRHIIGRMNQETYTPGGSTINTISIIDFSGFLQTSAGSTLDQLLRNSSAEFLYNLSLCAVMRKTEMLQAEEVSIVPTEYFDNSNAVRDILSPRTGLISMLEERWRKEYTETWLLQRMRSHFDGKSSAIRVKSSVDGLPLKYFHKRSTTAHFTVQHFAGEVEYSTTELMNEDWDVMLRNFRDFFESSTNEFVASLFRQEVAPHVLSSQCSENPMESSDTDNVAHALDQSSSLLVTPPYSGAGSRARVLADDASRLDDDSRKRISQRTLSCFSRMLKDASRLVKDPNTNLYLMFSLNSNDRRAPGQFNTPCVRAQVQALGIPEIIDSARSADFSIALPFGQFIASAGPHVGLAENEFETVRSIFVEKQWPRNEAVIGSSSVLLSERCWMEMEKSGESTPTPPPFYPDWRLSRASTHPELLGSSSDRLLSAAPKQPRDEIKPGRLDAHYSPTCSECEASTVSGDASFRTSRYQDTSKAQGTEQRKTDMEITKKEDPGRVVWIFIVYAFTFFIPDLFIHRLGRMSNKDVRMAWREKLAINIIIWSSCAIVIVFVMVVPLLICPNQHVLNAKELSSHNGKKGGKSSYVAIRGEVFDLKAFLPHHYPPYLAPKLLTQFAGTDVTSLFPVQVSALCPGVNGSVSDAVTLDNKPYNLTGLPSSVINSQDLYARYHDFRAFTNDSRPDWFSEQMMMLRSRYKKGAVGYSAKSVSRLAKKNHMTIGILRGRIYDLTAYMSGGRRQYTKTGKPKHDDPNAVNFMDQLVLDVFQQGSGGDVTKEWENLGLDADLKSRMEVCLDNLFYVGKLDTRNSAKCQFADYLPLVVSILLCSVVVFKFAASMQLNAKNAPEKSEKFIICQIPAYTEDEDSLRRAIDSVTRMQYDDKRKLLVVICDGMVVGEGNDRPTPHIVLDILGVPEAASPEPLLFESIGQGSQQHNMGQVYCGLYEVYGHLVPFLVIVKVGKPSEVSRPGNRGKRDSQMILMRFLSRVHYGLAMSPLELEIYHSIYNIIGVNPAFYEFILQIDADTIVSQDSATRMVSAFTHDLRLIALCGETGLSNAKSTVVTMLQVYEYFISHNLSKAFESLFGCVTCLPGCFSMYRIFASESGKPLFVSHKIVESYATVSVDTLHMKNLLSLGEDRYLTTLLLKYHGKYKMKFLPSARAWTVAPETWDVFLSQRRRWINSTVHNLIELLSIKQICGFFCFSMHFVVIVDLITTVLQPVAIAYIIYLIIQIVREPNILPIMAIVILAIVYGIQVVAFLIRRKWDMAGWMIIYLAALPVFSMCLPLYSFWYMDDFDWGNTRMVAGEKDKRIIIDEQDTELDPVPRKTWEEYWSESRIFEDTATRNGTERFSNVDLTYSRDG
ncbi:class V chitin synthase [Dactylonectria macrodidyma]|uniref:chitin synthase n=1 Tax=Dactylonectria macrodidyma TaxID=307937 RepID=A0A9P9J2M4_9HYPO|nr:class V chitin synthase [Dactylonectria macrodidyma]